MSRDFHALGVVLPSRIILWLFAVLAIVPFTLLILTSLKSRADLIQGPFVLPAYPHFENYANAWIDGRFNVYFLNSVMIVFPVVVVSIILGTLTGFGFAFLTFPFRRTIFVLLTVGMMVPTEAFIIPLYYEMRYVGLINTYAALILPQMPCLCLLPPCSWPARCNSCHRKS